MLNASSSALLDLLRASSSALLDLLHASSNALLALLHASSSSLLALLHASRSALLDLLHASSSELLVFLSPVYCSCIYPAVHCTLALCVYQLIMQQEEECRDGSVNVYVRHGASVLCVHVRLKVREVQKTHILYFSFVHIFQSLVCLGRLNIVESLPPTGSSLPIGLSSAREYAASSLAQQDTENTRHIPGDRLLSYPLQVNRPQLANTDKSLPAQRMKKAPLFLYYPLIEFTLLSSSKLTVGGLFSCINLLPGA